MPVMTSAINAALPIAPLKKDLKLLILVPLVGYSHKEHWYDLLGPFPAPASRKNSHLVKCIQ
jgi:hypothetical protein